MARHTHPLFWVAVAGTVMGCQGADLAGPSDRPVFAPPAVETASESTARPTTTGFGGNAPFDTCLPEGTTFGDWNVRYHGYGCVSLESTDAGAALLMAPTAAGAPEATHAPLALGPTHTDRVSFRTRLTTLHHTRVGSPPNPWEVAWVVWHYTDDEHFYYFIPKPNGWELGKRDPAYPGGQRFLATGSDVQFPIGRVYDIGVEQRGDVVTVRVDGRVLTAFRDTERPYRSGQVGLYSEDAAIRVLEVASL